MKGGRVLDGTALLVLALGVTAAAQGQKGEAAPAPVSQLEKDVESGPTSTARRNA